MAKVGAPPGGRVHWLIWNLPPEIKQAYDIIFDYSYHKYFLVRYMPGKRKPTDQFTVIRTSRRCWRCMYFNYELKRFEYFSEKTSGALAEKILQVYREMKSYDHNYS